MQIKDPKLLDLLYEELQLLANEKNEKCINQNPTFIKIKIPLPRQIYPMIIG
jgi:hypothetical protein